MTLYFYLASHRGSFYREGISLHMHIIGLNCSQRGLFFYERRTIVRARAYSYLKMT